MSIPPVLHSLLVGGIDYWEDTIVTCGRPRMVNSVTEGQSHDEGRGGRSVTGVHGSVTEAQNKSITGCMEMKRVGTEMYWELGFSVYYNVHVKWIN